MPLSPKIRTPDAARQLPPPKAASVLRRALQLQQAALEGRTAALLRGKNFALLLYAAQFDEAQKLFRRAAEELGGRVAVMHSTLSLDSANQEVQDTTRILGRLYDAVECQGMEAALVARIGQCAEVPVFDGAATQGHAVTRLAELLGDETPLADNRRFALQALLLDTIA
jgi:ornithine carbamoyltransferase